MANFYRKASHQSGRSMIEMLGVLAIIGVLSIGSISGYTKAMTRYKLNRHAEQIHTILSILEQYRGQWRFPGTQRTYLKPYYEAIDAIPQEMIKNKSNNIYDVFDNRLVLTTNGSKTNPDGSGYTSSAGVEYFMTSYSNAVCINFFQVAKEYHSDAFRIAINGDSGQSVFVDRYCYDGRICLKNLSLNDMQKLCESCTESESCYLWVSLPIYGPSKM